MWAAAALVAGGMIGFMVGVMVCSRAGANRANMLARALKACRDELFWMHPMLDRADLPVAVQRDKVTGAIAMADKVLDPEWFLHDDT
jgi:hypothetical protein